MRKTKKWKAFTLIELLIVIVIIGILAAALVPRLQSVQARWRNTARLTALKDISSALILFYGSNGKHAVKLADLESGYLNAIPNDPSMASNEPCRTPYFNNRWSRRRTTGWYYYFNSETWNGYFAYHGYLFGHSRTTSQMFVAARMEDDGSVNSHGGDGAYNVCNRWWPVEAGVGNGYDNPWEMNTIKTSFKNWVTTKWQLHIIYME